MQHSDERKAGREKKKDGKAMGGRQVDKCSAMRVMVVAAVVVGGGGWRADKEKQAATRKGRRLLLFLFNGRLCVRWTVTNSPKIPYRV